MAKMNQIPTKSTQMESTASDPSALHTTEFVFDRTTQRTRIPTQPGVYLMRDSKQTILYIGKAKNLRNRVSQYFQSKFKKDHQSDRKTRLLVSHIAHFTIIVTANEIEALLLENTLIKRHQPKYNILLKDGKQYPFIRVNIQHPWPRLEVARHVKNDGARYFGPYLNVGGIHDTIGMLNHIFPFRRCSDTTLKTIKRPCLLYQLKKCIAPCISGTDAAHYQAIVEELILFLEGRQIDLIKRLQKDMKNHAAKLEFEHAAVRRDQLHRLERLLVKQSVVSATYDQQDVVHFLSQKEQLFFCVLHIREKRLIHVSHYRLKERHDNSAAFESFVCQFYEDRTPPDVLYHSKKISLNNALLSAYFFKTHGKRVIIRRARRNDDPLVAIAEKNAAEQARLFHKHSEINSVGAIQAMLKMAQAPQRIECYDISNIQGSDTVASMVVAIDGEMSPRAYRSFVIRDVAGQDDFACMREVLARRFSGSLRDTDEPDLIVIDGGQGQLSSCIRVLDALQRQHIRIVGIAKSRTRSDFSAQSVRRSDERIVIPGQKNTLPLKSGTATYALFTQVRNEAHRFAITHHRKRRSKRQIHSKLDEISGIGPVLKKRLIQHFKSVQAIFSASEEALCHIPGMRKKVAQSIVQKDASPSPKQKE